MPEHITSGNAGTRYCRLLHRHCASLDLETAFKQIKISQNIQLELCTECQTDKCRCPSIHARNASSKPTNTSSDHKDIPDLVENKPLHELYPPVQSPSDEEADREVAAICRAPCILRGKVTINSEAPILYV